MLWASEVGTPAVAPLPSKPRNAAAPSSPPIFAIAVTASAWGGPCSAAGTERTSASSGSTARASLTSPSPNAAAARTVGSESPSASTKRSVPAASPIRPIARAAWRRTTASG